MDKKNARKRKKYTCCFCDFKTYNRTNYNTHLLTKRHKMKAMKVALNDNKTITNEVNKVLNDNIHTLNDNQFVCFCGKRYKYKSGLSRHRTKCTFTPPTNNEKKYKNPVTSVKNLGQEDLLSDLKNCDTPSEALEKVIDAFTQQQKIISQLIQHQSDIIPKIGNNNNNKININVFLNERCKDAMNLTDFIDKIKVSIEDLEYTNKNGYVQGISNIFTKQLTDLKVTERPIHCSDSEKLHFYIKDENKWGKDINQQQLDRVIKNISKKQQQILKEWTDKHPDFADNQDQYFKYQKMIYNMLEDNETTSDDMNEIKKKISENVDVNEIIMPL